jgi:transcriptional regulator with XRE-family HTH domain
MSFCATIRKHREGKKLLLRQAAAYLQVDTAFVSKIERGERTASREQVIKLADFLGTSHKELLTEWLANKILNLVNDDDAGGEALKLAVKKYKK